VEELGGALVEHCEDLLCLFNLNVDLTPLNKAHIALISKGPTPDSVRDYSVEM
jgi:hypothetical protein